MSEAVFGVAPRQADKVRVFALRSDEYGHFVHKAAGNFVSEALFQPLLFTSPGGEWNTFSADVRKHELAHYVSTLYVPMQLQPRWFAEGLAGYLETIRYDAATGEVEIGHSPRDYQYLRYMKQATWDELWSWDPAETYESQEERLYETSWAILHYIFDQRHADLLEYEHALARGAAGRWAWEKIFPDLDERGLHEAVEKYLNRGDFKVTRAVVAPVSIGLTRHPLVEADVLGLRGAFYMITRRLSRRAPDESERLAKLSLAASFKADPASFWANQVSYFYFDELPGSAELAKRAISRQEDNWLAWVWYADVLRTAKSPVGEERSALDKAQKLAPNNRLVLTRLAELEARTGAWQSSLELANQAAVSPPRRVDTMVVRAAALSHLGHCNLAEAIETDLTKYFKSNVPKDIAKSFAENHAACTDASQGAGSPAP
jgi:hypothetical protein